MRIQHKTYALGDITNSNYCQIQFIFPFVVASLIVLGIAHFILNDLKQSSIFIDQNHKCNLFEGKWMWDNKSYPLYREESCPYLTMQVSCQTNGRPDSLYQNWRWQPNGCTLPRFNASKFLEILRNKRMMLVGDSVQRVFYQSLICLVQSAIPDGKKSYQIIPPRRILTIEEFNATIEFFWAPFLVEAISGDDEDRTVLNRTVKLDSLAKQNNLWEGVDILVFETYVWWIFQASWMHKPLINATYGSNKVTEYNIITAYRLALETWANWIESHINPQEQKVLFVTMSPSHLWSWEWKGGIDGNCFNESYPIEGPHWGIGSDLEIMKIVKDIIEKLKVDVRLLNITQMSEFRKDGHSSVFGEYRGNLLTKNQRSQPVTYADCIHWCLPGVPDAWNEILYAIFLQDYQQP